MNQFEAACPRDGPHSLTRRHILTRSSVLDEERPSWAGRLRDESAEFYYDGINFWHCGVQARELMMAQLTPEVGWWHRADCRCRHCSAGTSIA